MAGQGGGLCHDDLSNIPNKPPQRRFQKAPVPPGAHIGKILMNENELRQKVEELTAGASAVDPSERAAFLERACEGIEELRAAVVQELARAERELMRTRLSRSPNSLPDGTFPGCRGIHELSTGGQGRVYKAWHEATRREVAIKVLLVERLKENQSRRRFEREITTLAGLKHPDIVSIFDAGVTRDDRPYFVMEYVRGMSLDQYTRENKPSIKSTLRLFARICRGVHHAHQHHVIHRDLKPSNILVDDEGNPKILDFGVAKPLVQPLDAHETTTGQTPGTPLYMAPEQMRRDPKKVDARTDVYALGVILYRLLTGNSPYPETTNWQFLRDNILYKEPLPPDKNWKIESGIWAESETKIPRCPVDRALKTILLKALAKERERRYQSAAEMADDIERYVAGEPIRARRDSPAYYMSARTRVFAGRYPLVAYFMAIWAAAFLTESAVIKPLYIFTPLNQMYEDALRQAFDANAMTRLDNVRIVAFSDARDMATLARVEGIDGVNPLAVRSFRALHGRLMEKLALAEPRVVAWDIAFPGETEHDAAFVRGVQALHQSGAGVVVGTTDWSADDAGLPYVSRNIRPHVRYGSMTARLEQCWRIELLLQRGNGGEVAPSFALATAAALARPDSVAIWRLDPDNHRLRVNYKSTDGSPLAGYWIGEQDVIQLTEIDLNYSGEPMKGTKRGDNVGLLATPMPPSQTLNSATIDYLDVIRASPAQLRDWFNGKIVIVADRRAGVDSHLHADGRWLSGCYIQAVGIETLLSGLILHVPGTLAGRLILLGGALFGIILVASAKKFRTRFAMFVLGAAVVVVSCLYCYKELQILCNPLVPVVAGLIAVVLGAFIRREALARAA